VGCPSSDLARTLDLDLPEHIINGTGSGAHIDPTKPFLLTLFHPTTTTYGSEQEQMWHVLRALEKERMPTILLWPNIDAGSDHISKAIRVFRDQSAPDWLRTITNLNPENYLRVLSRAACAVGNSSSFVRDAGYFGTPVVLVGGRQEGREVGPHVTPVVPREADITAALRAQRAHGRYEPCTLYGDGYVADRIAESLATLTPYKQKHLHYIYDDANTGDRDSARRLERNPAKELDSVGRKAVVGIHG
jgi:UDP-N-acetylglucosamine 2-epimerase